MAKQATITNVDDGDDVVASWGDAVKLDIENLFIDKTVQSVAYNVSKTFDLDDGAIQLMEMSGSPTLAITNQLLNRPFALILKENGTGGFTPTWFDTILWAYGLEPSPDTSANAYNAYMFIPVAEAGGNWTYIGFILGEGFS